MRRDDPDVFEVLPTAPLPAPPRTMIEALSPIVTPARLARMRAVAERRTLRVVPVLEGLTDPHNTSAVMRSADAFGVHRVHVIPGPHGFQAARGVSKGTHRWLDVRVHETTAECVSALREAGYGIWVASMDGARTPKDLPDVDRIALVFGNEHRGPSPQMREAADDTYAIPMVGFAESLNVSVAAAITLQRATESRPSELSDAQRELLLAHFLRLSVSNAEEVLRRHGGGAT